MAEANAGSLDVDHKDGASRAQNGTSVLFPLLFGHAAAMTLKVAVVLNIPDILARAEPERGALSVHEIAKELPSDSVDQQVLHRVMRTLVHLKVFSVERVSESGTIVARYGLNPASRMLVRENNSQSFAPLLMYLNYKSSHVPWQHLHESVLYGKDAFEAAFGMTSWEYSDSNPEYGALWSAADKIQGAQKIEVLKRYDRFKDVNVLVDVGGYQGSTVAALVAAHPHIRGINFDLPHVIAGAPEFPGVKHVSGNLLEGGVPSGDTILMKNVVHLFKDEEAVKVLKNCKKALTANGKLLIYDPVIPSECDEGGSADDGVPPLMDMALLVYGGGVDRTEEQWRALLTCGGFPNARFICLQPQHWLIEATQ